MTDKDSTLKLGKGFGYIAWILALVAMTWFFSGVLDRQKINKNRILTNETDQYKEILLKADRYNQFSLVGQINSENVLFIVDTGASSVALSEEKARELNLRKGNQGVALTANGETVVYQTQINRLELGSITLQDIEAHIVTGMKKGDPILLGMSALKHLDTSFNGEELLIRQYQ